MDANASAAGRAMTRSLKAGYLKNHFRRSPVKRNRMIIPAIKSTRQRRSGEEEPGKLAEPFSKAASEGCGGGSVLFE